MFQFIVGLALLPVAILVGLIILYCVGLVVIGPLHFIWSHIPEVKEESLITFGKLFLLADLIGLIYAFAK